MLALLQMVLTDYVFIIFHQKSQKEKKEDEKGTKNKIENAYNEKIHI